MEPGTFYVCRNINNRSGPRTQSRCENEGKDRKQRSRCLVLITVGLGLICVLLLIFIILQHNTITAERDLKKSYKNTAEELNQTINSLHNNYTDLMTDKHQLQNNFSQKTLELETRVNVLHAEKSSLSQEKLKLESDVRSLSDELNMDASKRVSFFISNELKSWSDSRQYCRDRGADLVIINTEEKQRFISSLTTERVWMGLSDRENEGNMTWVNNSTLEQGYWHQGEPNDQHGKEDCIELMTSLPVLNNWNDLPCSEKRKGFCEKWR